MKERQRWKAEEDALLLAYVRQYGAHEWNLVSQRMNVPFNRDAKSCIERWKNYLKPGIKKGSLSEEEQRLVIHLQAKHGNKWKKIASEVPGRTAKRLGKWWEVFKEKQRRESKEKRTILEPLEQGKYDQLLENFAEKLVNERPSVPFLMAAPLVPPWLSNSNRAGGLRSTTTPSVTLSLSSSTIPAMPTSSWLQQERADDDNNSVLLARSQDGLAASNGLPVNGLLASDIVECHRELEEGHKAWMAHKKETAWRLRRVELQLEFEKAKKRREKMEEIESKVRALREEHKLTLEMIETDHREQLSILRKDAEAKERKLADHWASMHIQLSKFIQQICLRYGLQ